MNQQLLLVETGIELKPVSEADAAELFELTDANRARLKMWLPWLDGTKSEIDSLAFIKMATTDREAGRAFVFSLRFEGALAGVCTIQNLSRGNRSANIGYWIGKSYAGNGLARKCTRVLIDFAFQQLDLNRIEIRCATGNRSSQLVPEKLDFQFEGISRQAEWLYNRFIDHRVYSLLKTEADVRFLNRQR